MIQKTLYLIQNLSNGIAVAAESIWIGKIFQFVGKYSIIFNINEDIKSNQNKHF